MPYSFDNGVFDVSMDTSGVIAANDPTVVQMIALVGTLDEISPITRFTVNASTTTTSTGIYTYRMAMNDGRVWVQTLNLSAQPNVYSSLSAGDYWLSSELQQHWYLKDIVVRLLADLGVSSIRITVD